MSSPISIRPVTTHEYEAYGRCVALGFGGDYDPEEQARELALIPVDDTLAAFEGDRLVGTEGVYRMTVAVPGAGTVPMAGVTSVAVLPTHRRRGVLTALMRRRLDDMHEKGEWLAGLWASESAIYGRFGYGVATERLNHEVRKDRAGFRTASPAAGEVRLISRAEADAVIPPIFDRAVAAWPGTIGRDGAWWRYLWHDSKEDRGGRSSQLFAVHRDSGLDDAFAVYRTRFDWSADVGSTEVYVEDLVSGSAQGYAGIWRYLLDIDLMSKVVARRRPIDEPLAWMLADRGAIDSRVVEGLYLRLVDVPRALASRRYAAEFSLVLEVRDGFCPWNTGRYLLAAGRDGATCERSSRSADLVMDAADVAAVYLGGVRPSTLARAGRVTEVAPGAVGTADAAFRWQRAPWCDRVF